MKRSTVFSIAAFVLMTLSLPALGQIFQDPTKWVQLPDMDDGFDQQSQWDITDNEPNLIKADDWQCLDGRLPVTDIHWWGSYFNDEAFQPDGFAILIYSTVQYTDPAIWGPDALLQDYFVPLAQANETVFGVDSVGETVYEYSWDLDPWFQQTTATWYWLSIVAVTPDIGNTPIWGWHTGFGGPDSEPAVKGEVPPGSVIPEGNPVMWQAVDYNYAFALTTIPEPGTLAILGFSALGLLALRRKNK
jgi:hypothetical protein